MNRASLFRSWRGAVLALLAAGVVLPACRGVDPPLKTCSYGGNQVLAGTSFPSTDGCNTCMCGPAAPEVVCTQKACLDAAPATTPADARPAEAAVPAPPADAAPRPDAGGAPPPLDASVAGPDMGQSGTCVYGGTVYQAGQSFPADDGCNTCTCLSNGAAGCTRKACPPSDAAAACDLQTRFEYGEVGGLRIFVERSVVEPGNKYTRTRTPVAGGGAVLSCAPALPRCGTTGAITAAELDAAFMHPDVQAALAEATPPVFGRDLRPVDGTVLEVKRADGRGFLLGQGCNAPIGCRNIPAGIAQLGRRLRDLDRQQLAAPECDALRSR